MKLQHDYWTGHFENILVNFIKSISHYSINHSSIQLGITNNPERRLAEYIASKQGWKRMVVKYETTSVNFINIIEEKLTNYHWKFTSNIKGNVSEAHKTPPYYVYIIIK